MNQPLGVVIPVFNGASFLRDLLTELTISPHCLEIFVVDDGSTDETASVAASFEGAVTCLRQVHAGVAAARNCGLEHVRTRLIGFLDVDDVWSPAHPKSSVAILDDDSWDVVVGKTQCFIINEGVPRHASAYVPHGLPFHTFNLGSAVFRRGIFDQVGGFDPTLTFGEDVDWFLRAREQGARIALLEETTLHYRLHERNSIGRRGAPAMGLLNALKLSIERRRHGEEFLATLPRIQAPS